MGVAKGLLAGLLLALSTTASADFTFPPAGFVAEPAHDLDAVSACSSSPSR